MTCHIRSVLLVSAVLFGGLARASAQEVFDVKQLPVQNGADAQAGDSIGTHINVFGRVLGSRALHTGDGGAFFWDGEQAIDIGTQGRRSTPTGLNDLDQVIVSEFIPDPDGGVGTSGVFFWDNGTLTPLGTIGGGNTIAEAINNAGQVVGETGSVSFPFQPGQAFLWTREQGMRGLGRLAEGRQARAVAVNELGQVAGTAQLADFSRHAFFWSEESGMVDIGPASQQDFAGINDRSQVAGIEVRPDLTFNWFRCTVMVDEDGTVDCLRETLFDFGDAGEFRVGSMRGMNNCGQILGLVDGPDGVRLAIWEPDGSVTLQPDDWDFINPGTVINDSGHVVFEGIDSDFEFADYFWNPGTNATVRLPTLGFGFKNTRAINDFDEITGASADFDGIGRAVVWRPLGPLPNGSADLLALIEQLKRLYSDGRIFKGDALSLLAKLTAADNQLRDGKVQAAAGVLDAAQNQIDQLIRNGFINAEVGAELFLAIDEIIAQLD